ncbi:hypothetical protein BH23ACT2_BH23ACT2_09200 [soil metagenome]
MFTEANDPGRVTPMVGPPAIAHPARRPRRRPGGAGGLLAAVAATLVLVASACGGSDDDPAADGTTSTPPGTTSTTSTTEATEATEATTTEPPTPEEEVEAAYLEAMAVFFDVSRSPDPDDERLAETNVEPNLTAIRGVMTDAQEDGIYVRYPDDQPPVPEILTIQVDEDVADLTVCLVADGQQVRASDERVVDDEFVSRFIEVSMRQVNDSWKIGESLITGQWQDGKGCER